MNLNSPVTARMTQAVSDMPEGFAPLRLELTRGLPEKLDITPAGLRVVLSVATGLVRPLVRMAPDTVVLTSDAQRQPAEAPGTVTEALAESRERAAPRLLFIAGRRFAAICPLITGTRVLVPGPGHNASAVAEIWVTSFALTASALVGQGATGSRIDFGWRLLLRGTDRFDSAVLRPSLRRDLAYSRKRDGADQVVAVDAELLSPDAGASATAGGLNWRLMHDRL